MESAFARNKEECSCSIQYSIVPKDILDDLTRMPSESPVSAVLSLFPHCPAPTGFAVANPMSAQEKEENCFQQKILATT